MEIGKRITEIRTAKGLTTNALANKAGITQTYLRDIEIGKKNNPTYDTLSYICEALGVSLAYFFDTTDDSSSSEEKLIRKIRMLDNSQQQTLSSFIDTVISK